MSFKRLLHVMRSFEKSFLLLLENFRMKNSILVHDNHRSNTILNFYSVLLQL